MWLSKARPAAYLGGELGLGQGCSVCKEKYLGHDVRRYRRQKSFVLMPRSLYSSTSPVLSNFVAAIFSQQQMLRRIHLAGLVGRAYTRSVLIRRERHDTLSETLRAQPHHAGWSWAARASEVQVSLRGGTKKIKNRIQGVSNQRESRYCEGKRGCREMYSAAHVLQWEL